jgi:hypothetical protein
MTELKIHNPATGALLAELPADDASAIAPRAPPRAPPPGGGGRGRWPSASPSSGVSATPWWPSARSWRAR